MVLSIKDKLFLIALKADPFMSINDLAEKLGISWITAKKRYEKLKSENIIRNPIAIFRPEPLGLERVNVLVETPTIESLMLTEKACTIHPYTHYRARVFGKVFGLFIQFDTPKGTEKKLKDFLEGLQTYQYINSFQVFKSKRIRFESFPDLSKFDVKSYKWNFSWEEWIEKLNEQPITLPESYKINTNFNKFLESHFTILRKITANAEVTQKEIKEELNLSRTEAYRQYHYVLDKYIDSIRLIYDRRAFNLTETFLTIGKTDDRKKLAKFFNNLKNNPPPFHFSLDLVENNGFIFWCNMDTHQVHNFNFSLWKVFPKMNTYVIDSNQSSIYWFYPPNFDFKKRQWKTSREYMIEEPLAKLRDLEKQK